MWSETYLEASIHIYIYKNLENDKMFSSNFTINYLLVLSVNGITKEQMKSKLEEYILRLYEPILAYLNNVLRNDSIF